MAIFTIQSTGATDRLVEAAAWRVRLTEVGADASEAFETWLGADTQAADAWRDVQAIWDHFDENVLAPDLMSARRDALDRALRSRRSRTSGGPLRAMTAGIAIAATLIAGSAWFVTRPQVFQTTLGERRTIALADGSRITLDSASKVEVRYTKDARKIALTRGEARFDVAHDVQRPFSVRARDRTVIATGTAFYVDVASPEIRVTLIEGHVVVLAHKNRKLSTVVVQSTQLRSGQQYVAASTAAPTVSEISMERAAAWESGRIVVDNEPLAQVVDRINRYTSKPVKIDDPAISRIRLSGVFTAGDINTFVDTVTRYLPVEAVTEPDGSIRFNRRG